MAKYSSSDVSICGFVSQHNLQKQADEIWGEGWEPDGDNEMIEELLHCMGESNYVVTVDSKGKIDVVYDHDSAELNGEINETKETLRLALLQLQEYSDNELIIADGQTRNIQEELDKLS